MASRSPLTLDGPTTTNVGWEFLIVEEGGFRLECKEPWSRVWKLLPGEGYLAGLQRVQKLLLEYGDEAYQLPDSEIERLAVS